MNFFKKTVVAITNVASGKIVCSSALLADNFVTKLFGLLGKKTLDENAGLLIKPSSGVHTFGMAFPIDIVSLDSSNRVIGAWENVGPWKIRALSLKTRSILELPFGRISRCEIAIGNQLVITIHQQLSTYKRDL